MTLLPHQIKALDATRDLTRVAYYLDMGLGKTFVGSEKLHSLGYRVNLVICQKSKVDDWCEHFKTHYPEYTVYDLTTTKGYHGYLTATGKHIGVINYDLVWRRPEITSVGTLMLDESSMIQHGNTKRTKFISKIKHQACVLLSGTPCNGKYENLLSQIWLLGWYIKASDYWDRYIDYELRDYSGYPVKEVKGYKHIDELKHKLREHGAVFMKTAEAGISLPDKVEQTIHMPTNAPYRQFMRDGIIHIGDDELVGDTCLKELLYARMICGSYNSSKLQAVEDLLESTDERFIIFYNFQKEKEALNILCKSLGRPVSFVDGQTKDLTAYEHSDKSVILIQYQAGAMGLNLQKCHRTIYFTLPLSSELYEQSKARTARIGQESTCFYYNLIVKGSVEEHILSTLNIRQDYTDELFRAQRRGE